MTTSNVVAAVVYVLSWPFVAGCNTSDPTSAVLANEYPPANDAGAPDSTAVYKGWWAVALFPEPVAAGQVSAPVRVVQGTDYGYALLAPGWDPSSGSAPTTLIPVRSAQKLSVARGDTLKFAVSDTATVGNCATGEPLAQEDADFITQRIFPSEFANVSYYAKLCTTSPASAGDAGDAGTEGAAGAPAGSP